MEYVFSDTDRQYGKKVGVKRSEGDFRCYQCIDFSFYEREVSEPDAGERCTYCAGFVFITSEVIAQLEVPKPVRPVNLAKREVQRFDLLTIAYNLGRRVEEVSYALDKARQQNDALRAEIARLKGEGTERETGFAETAAF
ncbi:hypothetical protein HW130_18485 [Streptomyces sp. PKU-EA00015]|uniref:hypothetical protein n=1 Tax=Streptomyces sp. PKU-EA00015 TaxID=2748326 RepID=UPI0015A29BFC|nr:hypothetical protein [Streptomyces sp. PKU-EA00015]NWF28231.1 hypothetical protein [Streptomyces sp. PKU-EA00015]